MVNSAFKTRASSVHVNKFAPGYPEKKSFISVSYKAFHRKKEGHIAAFDFASHGFLAFHSWFEYVSNPLGRESRTSFCTYNRFILHTVIFLLHTSETLKTPRERESKKHLIHFCSILIVSNTAWPLKYSKISRGSYHYVIYAVSLAMGGMQNTSPGAESELLK